MRGIRVMPEFDVPGHASSWCTGYPKACPSDPECSQPLNVAREGTFDLIDDVVAECVGVSDAEDGDGDGDALGPLFPDELFHLGGDEVDTSCWESDSEISTWLRDRDLTPDGGYRYFVGRASEIALRRGRRPVQWSEVYDHFGADLNPQTVVHVWKSGTNVTEVVERGYDALVNVGYNKGSWYFDNLDVKWDDVYETEPCGSVPSDRPDLCSRILGGHGEMWGETVDASDLESTVWPRLAAVAERLWSPRGHGTSRATEETLIRMQNFRCLLNERGVRAAPVDNEEARRGPPGPGSCFEQRRRAL